MDSNETSCGICGRVVNVNAYYCPHCGDGKFEYEKALEEEKYRDENRLIDQEFLVLMVGCENLNYTEYTILNTLSHENNYKPILDKLNDSSICIENSQKIIYHLLELINFCLDELREKESEDGISITQLYGRTIIYLSKVENKIKGSAYLKLIPVLILRIILFDIDTKKLLNLFEGNFENLFGRGRGPEEDFRDDLCSSLKSLNNAKIQVENNIKRPSQALEEYLTDERLEEINNEAKGLTPSEALDNFLNSLSKYNSSSDYQYDKNRKDLMDHFKRNSILSINIIPNSLNSEEGMYSFVSNLF